MSVQRIALMAISFLFLSGCASSAMKARKEQQAKVAQSSKLYCEFINGEVYPDVDVALNLEMAKRCDSDKPFTITSYKTPSENQGILYCCSTARNAQIATAPAEKAPAKAEKAPAKATTPKAPATPDKKEDKEPEEIE